MTNDDFRPQWLDEVAAMLMAAMRVSSWLSHRQVPSDPEMMASWAYGDAEALIAEGKRRRGEGE